MAADRGAFICQSQSLNIFMENATFGKLTSMHFYGWKKGLKTGMYYLRTKAARDAIKFTVDKKYQEAPATASTTQAVKEQEAAALACSIENGADCRGNVWRLRFHPLYYKKGPQIRGSFFRLAFRTTLFKGIV